MAVTNRQLRFIATKNPAAEYDTVVFSHPEFGNPIRLVANCFSEQVFAGNTCTPVTMKVTAPEMGKKPVAELTLQFARIQVGDALNELIKKISDKGWIHPISLIYERYSELDRNNPTHRYHLYVAENGLSFNRDSVQVKAKDDNEMVLNASRIYTIEDYPGLSQL